MIPEKTGAFAQARTQKLQAHVKKHPDPTPQGNPKGKLAEHGNGVALVFTRCCTPWWQAAVRSSAVCFVEGRVEFIPGNPDFRRRSRSGAPSCLLAFGEDCAAGLARAGLGVCMHAVDDQRLRLAAA